MKLKRRNEKITYPPPKNSYHSSSGLNKSLCSSKLSSISKSLQRFFLSATHFNCLLLYLTLLFISKSPRHFQCSNTLLLSKYMLSKHSLQIYFIYQYINIFITEALNFQPYKTSPQDSVLNFFLSFPLYLIDLQYVNFIIFANKIVIKFSFKSLHGMTDNL